MTLRASLALGGAILGASLALAVTGRADPPVTGEPATVFRTVVSTRTVDRRIEGWNVTAWRGHAVRNRRALNASHIREQHLARRIRAVSRAARLRYAPTVDYAIRLASAVYGVSYSKMRAVAFCESTLSPDAVNGRYRGLFQEGPMFETGPFAQFGVFDPIANALTAAHVVSREGWGQWSCG